MQGRGLAVLLVWMPPRHTHWWVQNMRRQSVVLWPLHPASVPSVEVVEAMGSLCKGAARHRCLQVMHIHG